MPPVSSGSHLREEVSSSVLTQTIGQDQSVGGGVLCPHSQGLIHLPPDVLLHRSILCFAAHVDLWKQALACSPQVSKSETVIVYIIKLVLRVKTSVTHSDKMILKPAESNATTDESSQFLCFRHYNLELDPRIFPCQ